MAGGFLTRASASVHISHRFSVHFPQEVAALLLHASFENLASQDGKCGKSAIIPRISAFRLSDSRYCTSTAMFGSGIFFPSRHCTTSGRKVETLLLQVSLEYLQVLTGTQNASPLLFGQMLRESGCGETWAGAWEAVQNTQAHFPN